MARYVLDGAEHFIPIISETCWYCEHFAGREIPKRSCLAFPAGIPLEIWLGKNDHTEPFPNDNGIVFAPFKSELKQ